MHSDKNHYDLIVVGAGPAGLSAALYARRANKRVLVLEAAAYGGQIINAAKFDNYPGIPSISGLDFATTLYQQALDHGAEIVFEAATTITARKVKTESSSYTAPAILIATGSRYRKLNLAGEENLIGKGISFCATCDGNFYKNRTVAVYGGGNTALTDALYLSDLTKHLYLIYRRDHFRGAARYADELAKKPNVEFLFNTTIHALHGDEQLEAVTIKNDNHARRLPLDGLFVAIGQTPASELVKDLVKTDENGFIISSDGVHTSAKGLYVAGDVRQKTVRQVATAIADGAIAATLIVNELNEQ